MGLGLGGPARAVPLGKLPRSRRKARREVDEGRTGLHREGCSRLLMRGQDANSASGLQRPAVTARWKLAVFAANAAQGLTAR
jgi:hypothetical protein